MEEFVYYQSVCINVWHYFGLYEISHIAAVQLWTVVSLFSYLCSCILHVVNVKTGRWHKTELNCKQNRQTMLSVSSSSGYIFFCFSSYLLVIGQLRKVILPLCFSKQCWVHSHLVWISFTGTVSGQNQPGLPCLYDQCEQPAIQKGK